MAFWKREMDEELLFNIEASSKSYPTHAKNVIIFIGDGMSMSTITAARYYQINDSFYR